MQNRIDKGKGRIRKIQIIESDDDEYSLLPSDHDDSFDDADRVEFEIPEPDSLEEKQMIYRILNELNDGDTFGDDLFGFKKIHNIYVKLYHLYKGFTGQHRLVGGEEEIHKLIELQLKIEFGEVWKEDGEKNASDHSVDYDTAASSIDADYLPFDDDDVGIDYSKEPKTREEIMKRLGEMETEDIEKDLLRRGRIGQKNWQNRDRSIKSRLRRIFEEFGGDSQQYQFARDQAEQLREKRKQELRAARQLERNDPNQRVPDGYSKKSRRDLHDLMLIDDQAIDLTSSDESSSEVVQSEKIDESPVGPQPAEDDKSREAQLWWAAHDNMERTRLLREWQKQRRIDRKLRRPEDDQADPDDETEILDQDELDQLGKELRERVKNADTRAKMELERLSQKEKAIKTRLAANVPIPPQPAKRARVRPFEFSGMFGARVDAYREGFSPQQKEAVQDCVGVRGRLVVAPAGFGKTRIMIGIMLDLLALYKLNKLHEKSPHDSRQLHFYMVIRLSTRKQIEDEVKNRVNLPELTEVITFLTHESFPDLKQLDKRKEIPVVMIDECQEYSKSHVIDWTRKRRSPERVSQRARYINGEEVITTPAEPLPDRPPPRFWQALEMCQSTKTTGASRVYLFSATPCNDFGETKSLLYFLKGMEIPTAQEFNRIQMVQYKHQPDDLRPLEMCDVKVEIGRNALNEIIYEPQNPVYANWECLVSYFEYDWKDRLQLRDFPFVAPDHLRSILMTQQEEDAHEQLERQGGRLHFGERLDYFCQGLDSKYKALVKIIKDDYEFYTRRHRTGQSQHPFKMMIYTRSINRANELAVKLQQEPGLDFSYLAPNARDPLDYRPQRANGRFGLEVLRIQSQDFKKARFVNTFKENTCHIAVVTQSGIVGFDPPPLTNLVSMGTFWLPTLATQLEGRIVRRDKWTWNWENKKHTPLHFYILIAEKRPRNTTELERAALERQRVKAARKGPLSVRKRPAPEFSDDDDDLNDEPDDLYEVLDISYDQRQMARQDARAITLSRGSEALRAAANHRCTPQQQSNALWNEIIWKLADQGIPTTRQQLPEDSAE